MQTERWPFLGKNQKEMLDIKTLTEMKNVFVGVISRLDVAKERISDLEDRSIETSQVEMQRKKWPATNRTSKNLRTNSKGTIGIPEEERKNIGEIFQVVMSEKFSKINGRC